MEKKKGGGEKKNEEKKRHQGINNYINVLCSEA